MKKPHIHAELIKAWADGAEIQFLDIYNEWKPAGEHPQWFGHNVFRIKPEPTPDVITYDFIELDGEEAMFATGKNNLKLTWCGETRKLKSAEVI